MQIDSLSASEQRMSFSWRSPGVNVWLSPNAFISCDFDIEFAGRNSFKTQMGPVVQRVGTNDIAVKGGAATQQPNRLLGFASKVCFGSQDAFGAALTNYQLTINGASISNSRQNDYKTTLERCLFSPMYFQRNFSQCGGEPDRFDTVAVSGLSHTIGGAANGAGDGCVNAYTADSGIQKRCANFLSATVALPDSPAVTEYDKRRIRVRWPVNGCGIFTGGQLGIDQMSDSNPQRRSCMALPHINVATLDLLFEDLAECLIRNLTSRSGDNEDAGGHNIGGNTSRGGVRVKLVPDTTSLHLEYLRFGLWRNLRDQYQLQCFKISVHDASSKNAVGCMRIPAALTRSSVNRNLDDTMPCIGVDRGTGAYALNAAFSDNKYLEAKWTGIVTAQCPSYLVFLLQKSSKQYVLGGSKEEATSDDAIGKQVVNMLGEVVAGTLTLVGGEDNIAAGATVAGAQTYFLSRNTDASASIQQFALEIQSSVGSYVYSGDFPYLKTKAELFRDHQRYCVPGYLDGDINKWSTHAGCLLLGADSFIRGLTTDGVAYPLNINASVKFACQRQYIDGTAACGYNANASGGGVAIQQDIIHGKPVMLQIYPKSRMTVSPSSALLSSQNMSHASGIDLIARKGGGV
jgi:hypothetical protein